MSGVTLLGFLKLYTHVLLDVMLSIGVIYVIETIPIFRIDITCLNVGKIVIVKWDRCAVR